jgi:homoserine kinase
LGAGATAVALSRAGPSLAAFAPDGHAALAAAGVTCRTWVLASDAQGVPVE